MTLYYDGYAGAIATLDGTTVTVAACRRIRRGRNPRDRPAPFLEPADGVGWPH